MTLTIFFIQKKYFFWIIFIWAFSVPTISLKSRVKAMIRGGAKAIYLGVFAEKYRSVFDISKRDDRIQQEYET